MKSWKREHVYGGFTLIELLVVVAIIGIIVAIAITNFQVARVKAQVARVEGDHHAIALAAQQYKLDNGTYMKDTCASLRMATSHTDPCLLNVLSTPVAYLSAPENVDDPFQFGFSKRNNRKDLEGYWLDHDSKRGTRYGWYEVAKMGKSERERIFKIRTTGTYWKGIKLPGSIEYIICSRGPDLFMNIDDDSIKSVPSSKRRKYEPYNGVFHVYDPSNGTYSFGDIYRCGP